MRVSQVAGWRTGLASLALLAAVAGGGVAMARPSEQAVGAVSIVDFAFQPGTLTVSVGARVTWTNTGQATHTTSANGGQWDSGLLSPGSTFSFTFSSAGSFAFHCNVHPSMTGTITVQAAAQPPAAQPPGAAPAQPRPQQAAVAPAPPRTGTGTASDSGATRWWAVLVVAGAFALTGAAGIRFLRRRR
jgi:plastocyanin